MKEGEKIEGQQGTGPEKKSAEEIITKEETMFKIGSDGKAISELFSIYIYDRKLDSELMGESLMLMQTIKKHIAINKVILDLNIKQSAEIKELKEKAEKEPDKKLKDELKKEVMMRENTQMTEESKTQINSEMIEESIKESREVIKILKAEKEKQTIKKQVELIPCTTSESYLSFEKGKTIEGKETKDWVADLISKKITNPKYTFDDALIMKSDYKIALKEAIADASGYKVRNYRDIIMENKLAEERPLTTKKG